MNSGKCLLSSNGWHARRHFAPAAVLCAWPVGWLCTTAVQQLAASSWKMLPCLVSRGAVPLLSNQDLWHRGSGQLLSIPTMYTSSVRNTREAKPTKCLLVPVKQAPQLRGAPKSICKHCTSHERLMWPAAYSRLPPCMFQWYPLCCTCMLDLVIYDVLVTACNLAL